MRLGVYADLVYRSDGESLSTDRAFVLFVTGLAGRCDEIVLFGRLDPEPGRAPYVLPSERVRHVPLPHYARLTELTAVLRSFRGALRAFARELPHLDAVWIFGPYPLSLLLIGVARRRRVPVVLGVRQDFPEYVRNRLPSSRWAWAVPVAWAFEGIFRLLAVRVPTVVVGEALGLKYRGRSVLATGFSLVPADEIVPEDQALARPWNGRLLTVGRIDREKNPLLLAEVLAALPDVSLAVVGIGPLAEALQRRAAELGVADRLELKGYVPAGPLLWEEYRHADAFLHVSLTEGLPQVLFEAQAAGLPVIGTDVGGVAAALGGGERGLLVPPSDAGAAAAAVARLRDDEDLRRRLIAAGLAHARSHTLEAQLDRVAAFLRSQSSR